MPRGTRAPSFANRFGSRRKSTTSCSSLFASSRPATCSHVTDDFDCGVTSFGFTRGISCTVRQRRYRIRPKKTSGSHVSRPEPMSCRMVAAGMPTGHRHSPASPLALPSHFAPARVHEVWRVDYEQRAVDAATWADEHGLRPAGEDERRVCLLLVDCQNTFCTPGFELVVPGAVDDNRRLCEFLYRNLCSITKIVASLDTHQATQIFHGLFLVDAEGRHPEPYTVVSSADVERGVWRAADPTLQEHLRRYVRALESRGRFELTIWPYHA